jgi:hypothetical protein
MKLTMTKIWVIAGLLALIGIAQAQMEEPADKASKEQQAMIKSNPYLVK